MYTKEKFKNCIFNPMEESGMLSEYPRLEQIIKEEWKDVHLDSIIRFAICCYDPKSPLIKDEPSLNERKMIAADISNMGSEIQDEVFNMIYPANREDRTPFVHELIFEYLRRFAKSKEFAAIAAIEFKFWEQIKQVLTPITGKNSKEELEAVQKKSLVSNEIEIDLKRIDTYYMKFFGEDEMLQKKASNRFTPERIASK
jgi:hypothetical protein